MTTLSAVSLVLQDTSDGLSFGEVIANIPRDPAALVVYVVLIGAGFLIWKYGRSSGSGQQQ